MKLVPMESEPLVSILIPLYNYAAYIAPAVESVLCQSYTKLEILVTDNGSTDNSYEIICELAQQDSRVIPLQELKSGSGPALNTAYERSSGKIILVLDADDLFTPGKISSIVDAFKAHPTSGFCVHTLQPVTAAGRAIGNPFPWGMEGGWCGPTALIRGGSTEMLPPSSGLCFRREITDRIFPLPEHIRRGMDLYLMRTAQFLTEITSVHQTLGKYRIHGANLSGTNFPDADNIRSVMENFVIINEQISLFLNRQFGPEIAEWLHLEDNPLYRGQMLALYTLERRPKSGVFGYSAEFIVEGAELTLSVRIWRLLLSLPPLFAVVLFKLWWGKYAMKTIVGRIRRIFRRAE